MKEFIAGSSLPYNVGSGARAAVLDMISSTVKPLCLWSGPRNVSTALMYSFAELDRVRVIDEPLYGHYLRVSGAQHPGRDDVIANMNCDGDAVLRELIHQQHSNPEKRLFCKHMAHHLIDMDLSCLEQTRNILLIRDPREMLPSLVIQLPDAQLRDVGLEQQWRLFRGLQAAGETPVVIDSRELLLDPAGILAKVCDATDITYSDTMLSWPAGPRREDGIWAPHWYHAVHESTGFEPYRPKRRFPESLKDLLDECSPWYERLFEHALRAETHGDFS